METIFTKIINRELPANIVYEDEQVLAFLDITPVNHGHTLVIPKKHFTNVFDADPEILAQMIKVGQKIAQALKASGLAEGVNILLNNGAAAGQEVFHSHLHVIPRHTGDNAYQKPSHVEVTPQELATTKDTLVAVM
jgi:histidine triad (HIT) family protein